MTDDMASKQNKIKINSSVSRKLNEEYDKLASTTDLEGKHVYSGKSNLIETALTFYLGAQSKEREDKTKQLQAELDTLKKTCDLDLKRAEDKIRRLEAEIDKNKDLFIKILINHPELHAELFPDLQKEDNTDTPKKEIRHF